VSQSKFTLLKTMSRENCGEIMEFFPKGLNPVFKCKPNST
jgi:hypothetical protein